MSSLAARRASLQRLLSEYAPETAMERGHAEQLCALVTASGDPFDREHYVPGHFTASAFVLSPERDALLLIHHRKLQRWLQPGGHIEPIDTDTLAAAVREVREETGVEDLSQASPGIFDVDVHAIPARSDAPSHAHFDIRFLFQAHSRKLRMNEEVAGAQWVPLAQVSEYESDESVLRAVRKLDPSTRSR